MRILLKLIAVLVLLGGLALVGFAYLGDMDPDPREMTVPVDLNDG